jgi:MSHA biogenesis protein MshN
MSLINQMLQDLDARRADTAGTMPHGEQIRAVPEHRGNTHLAWWLVLALTVALAGVLAWLLLRPAPTAVASRQEAPPRLPLKLDTDMAIDASHASVSVTGTVLQATAAPTLPADTAATAQAPETSTQPAPVMPAVPDHVAVPPAAKTPGQNPATTRNAPVDSMESRSQPVLPTTAKASTAAKPRMAEQAVKSSDEPTTLTGKKQYRELTPQQQAEDEYRKAIMLLQQGKAAEASDGLEAALRLDPRHVGARQALIGVLLDEKRTEDAVRIARDGLGLDLHQAGLAMILARLQLEKGDLHPAIETLQRTLPFAADHADYQAFLAALLQRDGKHKQAIEHYLQALQKAPQNGVWWMGLGISLQADQRLAEAREAFQRAKATSALSPELLAFVDTRLGQLPH